MTQSNRFFATARPGRLFFRVAIPGMISMLAMSIYSLIEGVFIGHILGEAAFAAVNVAIPFVMINFSLSDLVGVGSSVPISIALGRRDHARANLIFSCSLILIFLCAVLMGLVLFFASPALVSWMGASGELATLAVRYVRVYALLGPITTVLFALDNYLRISGFVRGSMWLNIFMSALTAVLVFLFLFVGGMQVEGSALATCIAMAVCVLIGLVPFLRGKTVLKFVRPRFSFSMCREIVACGSPVFLNNVAGRVAAILMNSALLRVGGVTYGQTAVAAYAVMMYASDIIQPMLYGMSDAVQPAIGYNFGAGASDRVRALLKYTFVACGAVSLCGTALMFFCPAQLSALFVKAEDTELLAMSVHAMRLFCLAYLFRWVGFVVQGYYSAIGRPLPASVLSLCNAMVFPILFIYLLEPWGLDGLWLNMAATSFCVMLIALYMLLFAARRLPSKT